MTTPFLSFATDVLGLTFTAEWTVLLRVSLDGMEPRDLEGEEREIARRLFGDVDVVPPMARALLVWSLGRGSGKTTVAVAIALFIMVTADVSTAGPGDVPVAIVVAPTKALARLGLRMARVLVGASPLASLVVRETEDGFELRRHDGSLVAFEVIAATRGGAAGRGRSILCVLIDEAEFFGSADADHVVNDTDVVAALTPRALPGAVFVLISTPWPTGTPSLMAQLIDSDFGSPATALVAVGASTFMQPGKTSLRLAYEREMARNAEDADREFNCARQNVGSSPKFFTADAIAAAVTGEPPTQRGPTFAALDFGLVADGSALIVAMRVSANIEIIAVHEMRPTKGMPLSPTSTADHFIGIAKAHGCTAIVHDGHYAQLIVERCAAARIAAVLKPGGNEGVVETHVVCKRALDERRVRMPEHARLIAALGTVRATPTPGGKISITMPRGRGLGHSDLASAFVLAVWAAAVLEARVDPAVERFASQKITAALAKIWPRSFAKDPRARDYDPEEFETPGFAQWVAGDEDR